MSGPKVVRIVTAAELLALREEMLRQLDHAVQRWQAQAQHLGTLEQADAAAVGARCDELRALLGTASNEAYAQWLDAEKAFLQRDLEQREEDAIARHAERRQQARRVRDNAGTLLKALQAAQCSIDAPLREALSGLAAGQANEAAEVVLARGMALLSPPPDPAPVLSKTQRDLAAALRVDVDAAASTQAAWLATAHAGADRDARVLRIDRHIAELQLLQGPDSAAHYLDALHRAEGEPREQRRNLLLDSLVLDLGSATTAFRQHRACLEQLQDLAGTLSVLNALGYATLLAQANACTATTPLATLQAVVAQCNQQIAAHQQAQAALARRQAVLDGLASLGYEVREGMATAWAETGAVVLKKAATPGYGVEVGGKADTGRMQVRAVALGSERDRSRDRDIETLWCGEFSRLQALLHDQGTELVVERALGVGAVPLKEAVATVEHRADPVERALPLRPG